MTLLGTLEASDAKFTLYFLGYSKEAPPSGDQLKLDLKSNVFGREAVLELTHNWGTEDDPNFKGYHTGNSDPQGYGHIAIAVDNLDAATDRLTDLGVTFKKRPNEGKMKGIAFIQDPDGYLVELVSDPHFAN
ncbi:hypothetical protein IWQ60_005034 [Tieghemiomyces parasiticus]|uniref:lactoylglutathione lyase n=1 Tax=Tieghemiomyces parasiticus TaxID=78921 RepID=A0A9W8AAB9_9FUNG|nr:hypothetical protein IWQ60_005034 [Tieghemiomyces parasiticus]